MGLQGNRESIQLAKFLKGVLEGAGFVVDGVWEESLIGGTGPGILIRQATIDGAIGQAIGAAFDEVGLEVRMVKYDAGDKVEVIVGYEPE